jgi:hypothetical protein
MLLTHYYHQDDRPFQTLSSLSDEAALNVIASLRDRVGAVYRRFDNPVQYLSQRRLTESWVRSEFIKQGGKPLARYPQYFVVNRAIWIEDGYNHKSRSISIPISAFNPDTVSFTYPDSMISYWLKDRVDRIFYRPEYHGRVFGLEEISQIIGQFGIPDREWQTEASRKYDLFIEAQVWDEIDYRSPIFSA